MDLKDCRRDWSGSQEGNLKMLRSRLQSKQRRPSRPRRTPYVQEQVNIGSGPPGSPVAWFRSMSNKPRFINTITFDEAGPDAPTIVLVHGYGAAQGFFFRNYDALAERFRVLAIDQIGWGASSRPNFTCKSTEETKSWFVDSLEEWRKAKGLDKFVLMGHSVGGYVWSRYALKHPEHVEHLVLVGCAGFSPISDTTLDFRSTWMGVIANAVWEANFTPTESRKDLGAMGSTNSPKVYWGQIWHSCSRIGIKRTGVKTLLWVFRLTDYIFHTLAARPSGELCLKYLFSLGAFTRLPLRQSASDWKVPTTFIYGTADWMKWQGAQQAVELMNVPTEIIRVPQGGHFVFMDNPEGFHAAVLYACRKYFATKPDDPLNNLPKGLIIPPRLGAERTTQSGPDVR